MIHRWLTVAGMVLCILGGAVSTVAAKTEWKVLQNLSLDATPIDMLSVEREQQLYILTDQGRLLIYGIDGKLKDRVAVGRDVKEIRPGPRDDLLYLISPDAKTVKMISIATIEEIDIQGAPFKGPKDAPVTVVVFSDFQ